MLIVAASGRALAASARRAGFVPLVADAFGDQDTLAVAESHVRVDLMDRPVDADKLIAALSVLAGARDCEGVVCGSGFEDRADIMARISERWTLIGNSAETVRRLKEPLTFAAICRVAEIPHPATSVMSPADRTGWLVKRAGGAGGLHVRPASDAETESEGVYFQRRVKGEPVSALLLGDGRRVLVLGFSAQWASPRPKHPFRYGGAVRPAALARDVKEKMIDAVERFAALVPLKGLNSADFLVDGDAYHLLEINPRPGATVDLFEPEGTSLFALHVEGCAGRLSSKVLVFDDAMAGAIVYAERDIDAMPMLEWPEWTADRPVAGSRVMADAPLCSVFAHAHTAAQAKELVVERVAAVHAMLDARPS